MLLPGTYEPQKPKLEGACATGRARPFSQIRNGFVEENGDWLSRRIAGECLVDRVFPKLHAKLADGGIGHRLWKPGQFQIQRPEGIVGVLSGPRNKLADKVGIIIAMS